MIYFALACITGLGALVWSSDLFVDGSVQLARKLKVPPILIGMLIIGFGTSAPELIVSLIAAIEKQPGIALGNVFGSNITNVALILGLSAILSPIAIGSTVLKKEMPILLGVTLLVGVFLYDLTLSRIDGCLIFGVFLIHVFASIRQGMKHRQNRLATEVEAELASQQPLTRRGSEIRILVGLMILIGSSRLLVWGATGIATALGLSELVIGLTIVAVGTSLPELASSIAASRKGEVDLLMGNIVGSNLFNILAVLGLSATVSPMTQIDPNLFQRDWTVNVGLSLVLLIASLGLIKRRTLTRWEGLLLLLIYFGYTWFLIA